MTIAAEQLLARPLAVVGWINTSGALPKPGIPYNTGLTPLLDEVALTHMAQFEIGDDAGPSFDPAHVKDRDIPDGLSREPWVRARSGGRRNCGRKPRTDRFDRFKARR